MKIKDLVLLCSTIGIATAAQTIDRRCLDCMCQASSSCNLNLRCHNAADGSYYCGPYQISWAYWADAGKPGSAGFSNDFEKCLVDRSCAEKTFAGYMSKWASDCNGDGQIDCLDFAAIHKTGPTAQCNQSWLKKSKYWTDFNRCYASSSPSSPDDSSSSGFTGSSNFPSNNRNHEVVEVDSDVPRLSGAYAISSSDPRPVSRTNTEITDTSSLPIPSSNTFTSSSSSSSYPSSSSSASHYSSSSSYSNYTEVTEESSSGGNIDANYDPPVRTRSPLPGRTVYETLSNVQPGRTRVVEEVTYEQPAPVQPAQPAPAPINVEVRPVANDYVERENAPLRTASNYHSSTPTNNYVYEQPAPVAQPVAPQPQPIAPVNTVTSFIPSSGLSTVSESCMHCLCQASSKCQLNKGCDGAYCGPYTLSWAYWTDGGKPGSAQGLDYPTCSSNQSCAEQAVNGYMTKWTRDCNGDGVVDCTDFALIHKLGPHGCGRLEALKNSEYWNRFESCHGVSNVQPAIEPEIPAVQPVVQPEVRREVVREIPYQPEIRRSEAPYQPEVRRPAETVSEYSPPRSSRIVEAVEPTARRNDFHEQPLNVPRPQPNAFFTPRQPSSGTPTSNIRISFNNRDVVNTALQDTPIIHTPEPVRQPTQPARQPVNSFNSFNNNRFTSPPQSQPVNSFNPRAQEYPPPRPQSAFASETAPETPRSYNSGSGSNIREVPANNDNTGFDDSSFSGRSVDSYSEPSSNEDNSNFESVSPSGTSGFNPFEPLNNSTAVTNDIVSQDCLNCMCHAASRCDSNIGCSSDSSGKFVCGVFQVDWEYWSDAGKPGNRADLSNLENFQMCLNNRKCADDTIRGYMKTHKMDCNGDGKIDCHDFAALHVVGPKNCRAKWYLDSKYHSDFNECISF